MTPQGFVGFLTSTCQHSPHSQRISSQAFALGISPRHVVHRSKSLPVSPMAEVAVAAPAPVALSKDDVVAYTDTSALVQQNKAEDAEKSAEVEHEGPRDPHVLPTFDRRSHSPILYLPPLLSSLPAGIVHPNYPLSLPAFSSPSAPRPLSTDSRLPSIDNASLSLHRALHNFHPVTDEYSTVPYHEAFNWDELELPEDEEREWYCVAFRSKRRDGSDGGRKCS